MARQAGLRRKANGGIGGTESAVAAPLHDLEEETLLEGAGIDLQIFGGSVAIVEDIVRFELFDPLRRQIGLGFEIVVIILGNRQQRNAVGLQTRDRRDQIVG